MVQDPDNDYDIDDGVYYHQDELQDSDGKEMTPLETRKMICAALQDGRFNDPPSVKTSCVRVQYEAGYHVDLPIYRYRTSDGERELSAGDDWVVSRASDVEAWFFETNNRLSPDETNGRQFRRTVRLLKKFARSRPEWKDKTLSGFAITTLAAELFVGELDRDDAVLRDLMQEMHDRLLWNLVIYHPVTPNATLTDGATDPKAVFFRERLADALSELKILDDADCTDEEANSAWDSVFNTEWFTQHAVKSDDDHTEQTGVSALAGFLARDANPRAVEKRGGGRYA
jgi:hypothetical protein